MATERRGVTLRERKTDKPDVKKVDTTCMTDTQTKYDGSYPCYCYQVKSGLLHAVVEAHSIVKSIQSWRII